MTTSESNDPAVAPTGGQRPSLHTAAADWDRAAIAERIAKAEEERSTFVGLFPAEDWPHVELEQYALGLGTEPNGFSYQLEFATPNAGSIRGGSSTKHLIFWSVKLDKWRFQSEYKTEESAWDHISKGFAQLVALGEEQRWDEIDDIAALWAGPAMRAKTTWMYFPDELLPIYAEAHLDHFLRLFNLEVDAGSSVTKSHQLLTELRALEEFHGWQPLEIMYFLYDWAHPYPGYEVVKIAPGADAYLWDDCRANDYIRVGWGELGDLTLFEDVDEIRAALDEHFPGRPKGTVTREARALDRLRSLQDGDIVVANRGTKQVVGLGRVDGGYSFRPDLADHNHVVSVDWFDTTARRVPFGSAWMPTIVQVKPEQYQEILTLGPSGADPKVLAPPPPVPSVHLEAERLLARTKQVIFYGPPGTGKTFSARRHAAWMLAGGSADPEAARAFGSSKELVTLEDRFTQGVTPGERPAWFAVANPQRWDWASLADSKTETYDVGKVEKNFDAVRKGDVVFGYSAAPIKAVAAIAKITRERYTESDDQQRIEIGSGLILEDGPGYAELQKDEVLRESEPMRHGLRGRLFRLEPEEAARLKQLTGSGNDVPEPGEAQLTRVTFHPTYTYEDFIEGYKPVESGRAGLELRLRDGVFKRVCRTATADPENQYVVLIDEINRGNVPKIFGELITLIESDKRGVSVTLPHSGESFSVPENVQIIGTMNTSDRSIHVLDLALRRRFGFIELLPDPSVLVGTAIGAAPLDELLRALNELIREHQGREKQIGHALLMDGPKPISNPATFCLAFKYELLPLLQEYVYGDYGQLEVLLGSGVIDVHGQTPRPEVINDPEQLIEALMNHLDLGVA